jgi:hypothetical protein
MFHSLNFSHHILIFLFGPPHQPPLFIEIYQSPHNHHRNKRKVDPLRSQNSKTENKRGPFLLSVKQGDPSQKWFLCPLLATAAVKALQLVLMVYYLAIVVVFEQFLSQVLYR